MRKLFLSLLLAALLARFVFADGTELLQSVDLDHPAIFQPNFASKSDWQQRVEGLRKQILVAEGLWPMPPRTALNAVIHGSIDREGYTIRKVFFASLPGHYVSGNLYLPNNRTGKLPAVLCPHGHWTNGRLYEAPPDVKKHQLAEGAESTEAGAAYPLQARCAMLARMGCVVFFYDMVGVADSKPIAHREGFTDAEAILRLQSFMGLQTWNSIRALDFIAGLPDVDPHRIAITGASGGGTQTFILSAIDDRVGTEFPAVMVGEAMQGGCICENAPLLRIGTNNVEFAAMFAPKPLGMSAANDWTAAMETDALPKIRSIYSLFGERQNVIGKHFNFEHNYNQVSREMMYTWLNEHFQLGWATPVKEVPFTPVPPAQLSVYDADHPRPTDACDARTLRQTMTRTSDEQLASMRRDNPKQYREVLSTALRAMVHDELPEPGNILVKNDTLRRATEQQGMPFVEFTPKIRRDDLIIWADPAGPSSLFKREHSLSNDTNRLINAGWTILCPQLFLTGEGEPAGSPTTHPSIGINAGQHYAGFYYGYNRSALGQRVHDLLTTIAYAKSHATIRRIHLVAVGDVAPAALLAKVLADDSFDRCAIDLNQFDCRKITNPLDDQMLPGLLKYGGLGAFANLCDHGTIFLAGTSDPEAIHAPDITAKKDSCSRSELIDYLLHP